MSFYTKRNDHTFDSLDEIAKELVSIDPDRFTWEVRESHYTGWYNLVNQDSVFEQDDTEIKSRMINRGETVARIILNNGEPGGELSDDSLDPGVAIIDVYHYRREEICEYLASKPEIYISEESEQIQIDTQRVLDSSLKLLTDDRT